ncbi:MAG: histidine ammonia-lyase [Candidatus Bipolaricaulota bacterium]
MATGFLYKACLRGYYVYVVVELDGHSLTLTAAWQVVVDGEPVHATAGALARAANSHSGVLSIVAEGRTVYGISTGLGKLSSVTVGRDDLAALQHNLVRSHAVGVGSPLDEEAVRGMLLFRANSLLKGCSGVRPRLVELLLGCLNAGLVPVVPAQGSVGASGDLAPLAHLALVLLGEGRAYWGGDELPGGEALARAGLEPVAPLAPKEGLALLNGTAYMLSLAFLAWTSARRALDAAVGTAALSFEALRGRREPLDERVHAARPHPGQGRIAAALRELIKGSQLVDTLSGDVQDPYSLRCLPQIIGPSLEALEVAGQRLELEMNSATDNPLVFADGTALSGGNFHGQILALMAELLAMGTAEIGASCERRIALLLSGAERGLPDFLTRKGGLHSGLMMAQYSAAALVAENKVLCHPACVDSVPTSGGKEDHNSMGSVSAWKALRVAENVCRQVALEMVCAAQAGELAGVRSLSPAGRELWERVRQVSPQVSEDRALSEEVEKLAVMVRDGELASYGL